MEGGERSGLKRRLGGRVAQRSRTERESALIASGTCVSHLFQQPIICQAAFLRLAMIELCARSWEVDLTSPAEREGTEFAKTPFASAGLRSPTCALELF